MTISAFPKIFAIGNKAIKHLFEGPVEVTEKLDGSQFAFGNIGGELVCRSKGRIIYGIPANNDLFFPAVSKATELFEEGLLPEGHVFYGETLSTFRHNTLRYDSIPKGYIALFGAVVLDNMVWLNWAKINAFAYYMDIGVVPKLTLEEPTLDNIEALLETESYLGGPKIEGIVVKNYTQPCAITQNIIFPITCGKYVSEAFKETHYKGWKEKNTSKGNWETYKESYRTEARWRKAIQHSKEAGTLSNDPKDIGHLIKMIQNDIVEEEQQTIKDYLWRTYGQELLRKAIAGFPEWYKQQLLEQAVANEN